VISLIDEFSKEIGLKYENFEGLSILGTKVIYEPFMLLRQIVLLPKPSHRL
jgi:hypothetical protein